jgi:hypothetical protein
MVVAPNTNVVRRGVIIRSATNLGRGLGRFSAGRNLNRSLGLPITNIGVVGTPQMVFTNLGIMTTHVNIIANQPPMYSIIIGRYRSTNAKNPRGGYQKPSIITTGIPDHKINHFVKPNKVALKYPNFKKDVDMNVHFRVFNLIVKANAETFEEYIINLFKYMLKDMALDRCHHYMSKFLECTFLKLTQAFWKCHRKI